MRTNSAFWDTSAIVPLCVFQDATKNARLMRRKFTTSVIWWGAAVEINSSLSRLKRSRMINDSSFNVAQCQLANFQNKAKIIRPSDAMLDVAVELPEKLGLRSLDAFQLASAVIWCKENPKNRPFICSDKRLGDAANEVGFDVVLVT